MRTPPWKLASAATRAHRATKPDAPTLVLYDMLACTRAVW